MSQTKYRTAYIEECDQITVVREDWTQPTANLPSLFRDDEFTIWRLHHKSPGEVGGLFINFASFVEPKLVAALKNKDDHAHQHLENRVKESSKYLMNLYAHNLREIAKSALTLGQEGR